MGLTFLPQPRYAQDPALAEIGSKIQWLMLFRVVMISVLLGATMLFDLDEMVKPSDPLQRFTLGLIIAVYVLTVLYALILPRIRRHLALFAHLQLFGDVLLFAALVWGTGGTESVFSFIFSLTIINGSIILYRTGALVTATTSSLAFLGLALLEGSGLAGRAPGWTARPDGDGGNLYFLTYIHIASFYLIAVLSSYLAELLRKADRRIRVQAEDIERIRALNAQIVGSIANGMMTVADGRILFFNRSAERISGWKAADVLGRPLAEILPGLELSPQVSLLGASDDGEERSKTPPPVRTRTGDRPPLSFTRPDGETILLGYRCFPLKEPQEGQGKGWLILFEDVTRIFQLEEMMRRSQRLASMGQLAAGIAHEVRNPLASISGAVQLLSCARNATADERALLEIVLRETDRLERLIASFLGYARPASRGRQTVGLRELILVTLKMFEQDPQLERSLVCQAEGLDEELWVEGDADQLKQVLWNLLTNAAQAMAGRQGTIRLAALRRESAEEKGVRWVEVSVTDEGEGMSREVQARIFDPFFTTRPKGTGLGLATVHRIIEEHGGLVEVQSEPGRGTRLSFLLREAKAPQIGAARAA